MRTMKSIRFGPSGYARLGPGYLLLESLLFLSQPKVLFHLYSDAFAPIEKDKNRVLSEANYNSYSR